jgi:hypothetical protein
MTQPPTCKTCPYWKAWTENEGNCRYDPPTAQGSPPTKGDFWCGKHPDFQGYLRLRRREQLDIDAQWNEVTIEEFFGNRKRTRLKNAFKQLGIKTVRQICQMSEEQLLLTENLGLSSVKELIQDLEEVGLKLKSNGFTKQ